MAKKSKTVHVDEYMDLVDDLRYNYISDNGSGPEVGDEVALPCGCPD